MDWTLITILILSGLILIVLEIFILPGLVVGILGGLSVLTGIYFSYKTYGVNAGVITTTITLAVTILFFILLFRSKTWKRASLHTSIDSKVNTESQELNIGDEGITITRLYPIGKAKINDNIYEVQSTEGIIEQNSEIIVNKIEGYKIFVTQKNK